MMLQKEYVDEGGNKCPVCRSDTISVKRMFVSDSMDGFREGVCGSCGAVWHEDYKLIGYDLLEVAS